MGRRRYTDADRASGLAALEANGGITSAYRTAQQIGVPVNTLKGWHSAQHDETADIRSEKRGDLAARLEDIAHQILDAMPSKLDEANLQQSATSLGIAIDKFRLLNGEPTEVTRNEIYSRELPERAANAAAEALKRKGYLN